MPGLSGPLSAGGTCQLGVLLQRRRADAGRQRRLPQSLLALERRRSLPALHRRRHRHRLHPRNLRQHDRHAPGRRLGRNGYLQNHLGHLLRLHRPLQQPARQHAQRPGAGQRNVLQPHRGPGPVPARLQLLLPRQPLRRRALRRARARLAAAAAAEEPEGGDRRAPLRRPRLRQGPPARQVDGQRRRARHTRRGIRSESPHRPLRQRLRDRRRGRRFGHPIQGLRNLPQLRKTLPPQRRRLVRSDALHAIPAGHADQPDSQIRRNPPGQLLLDHRPHTGPRRHVPVHRRPTHRPVAGIRPEETL